jgi:hypothetical protein
MRYSQMLEMFSEYGLNEYQVRQLLKSASIRKRKLPGGESGRALYSRQEIEEILHPFKNAANKEK